MRIKLIWILTVLITVVGYSQSNIPQAFQEGNENIASRGVYDKPYSLISEKQFWMNNETGLFEEQINSYFSYEEGKSSLITGYSYSTKVDNTSFEFNDGQISNYDLSSLSLNLSYSYDDNKNLVQVVLTQPSQQNTNKIIYANNRITSRELYNDENTLTQQSYYEYTVEGYIKKYIFYGSIVSSPLDYTIDEYFYVNDNLSEKNTTYYKNDIVDRIITRQNEYAIDGKLKSSTYNTEDSSELTDYVYDVYGNLIFETKYEYTDSEWVYKSKTQYVFDYSVPLEDINLPGSIAYVTAPYTSFNLPPALYYNYLIPKYENETFKNFVKQMLRYNWDDDLKIWKGSSKIEYELENPTLSIEDSEIKSELILYSLNGEVLSNVELKSIEIYNTLGQNIKNENLSIGVYVVKVEDIEGRITTRKILVNN